MSDRDDKRGGAAGGRRPGKFSHAGRGRPGAPRGDRRGGEGDRGGGPRGFGGKPGGGGPRGDRPGGGAGGGFRGKSRFNRDDRDGERAGGERRGGGFKGHGKPRGDFRRSEDAGAGGERKFFGKPRFDRDRGEGERGGGDRPRGGKPGFGADRRGGEQRSYGSKPRGDYRRSEDAGAGGERKFFGKPRFDRDKRDGDAAGRDRKGGGRGFGGDRRDGDHFKGPRKFADKPRFDRGREGDRGDARGDKRGGVDNRSRKPSPEHGADDQFVRVSGLPSVAELFRGSPDRVERLFFTKDMHADVNAFCSLLAARRKVYREVEADELRRIAGTAMHGGVVALAEPKAILDFDEAAAQQWAAAGEMLVVLDGIGNPQNFGAIARTAAFLGLKRLVVSDNPSQAGLSNAAYRIAKGGLEGLDVHRAADLPAVLRRLRAHFHVVGTALGQGGPVEALPLAPKPVALVLGNEENGLDPATLAACHSVVSIPGGGAVQSLNVSAVAAILIYTLLGRARRSGSAAATAEE